MGGLLSDPHAVNQQIQFFILILQLLRLLKHFGDVAHPIGQFEFIGGEVGEGEWLFLDDGGTGVGDVVECNGPLPVLVHSLDEGEVAHGVAGGFHHNLHLYTGSLGQQHYEDDN
jgi:hypothetical protein